MAARDKPAMKVSLSRSRFPTFLFIILVFIVVVLLYYYWTLSSSNQVLLKELKILQSRKSETEKRRSALESQVFEIENERRLAEEDLEKERSRRLGNERTAMEVSSELERQLQITTEQLYTAEENEKHYQAELEKLKRGVNSSSSDLRALKGRADELLKKYKEMKESHSSLLQKVTNLTSERDVCQKELVKVKMELDQQKKIQDVKVVPSDRNVSDKTNDAKKVKAADEGQSIGEGSDEEKKESEKDDENQDKKESEKGDENNDDKNTESSKKEKESVEEKNPVPSGVSANQTNISKPRNASVLPNVPGNIKPEGNKSQNEETDKRNQDNPDNSEEVDRETGKDEENTEQPNEEEPVTSSDKNIRQEENEEEVDEEGEKEEEESDDDLDKGGRVKRSKNLAADMRHRMLPLAGGSLQQMPRNAQSAGSMEEIRKLQKNSMDARGMMPGRISPLDIPARLEQVRRRKEAEDEDQ